MMKIKLKRIFFIYTEATVACAMLFGSLVELICGLVVPQISFLAFPTSVAFLLIAITQVIYIVKSETK